MVNVQKSYIKRTGRDWDGTVTGLGTRTDVNEISKKSVNEIE
jgi:hypothetical protein